MDTIRATIDAAYIQGILGFLGAIIGAVVLIFSIRLTAKNTVNEIKLEKVAESKRDQYIALTDAYTQFLVSSLILRPKYQESKSMEIDTEWDKHLTKYIELIGCINKVNLITTSKIRLELFEVEKVILAYQTSISNHYFNSTPVDSSKKLEKKVFEFAKLLRDDLGIESNPEDELELLKLRNVT